MLLPLLGRHDTGTDPVNASVVEGHNHNNAGTTTAACLIVFPFLSICYEK